MGLTFAHGVVLKNQHVVFLVQQSPITCVTGRLAKKTMLGSQNQYRRRSANGYPLWKLLQRKEVEA